MTPNIDILRQAQVDAGVRAYLDDADLVVADGMPLVWASRLSGTPLPERVAGSSLIWSLSAGLGRDNRSVYVIGGAPADRSPATPTAPPGPPPGSPQPAPDCASPAPSAPTTASNATPKASPRSATEVAAGRPDMVFVGLGFPKQEQVITRLREFLPRTWFIGCGAAVNFVAGDVDRAPRWMQRTGLEWAHRLGTEPRRLAGRYLRHDAPYALSLLVRAPRGRGSHAALGRSARPRSRKSVPRHASRGPISLLSGRIMGSPG